MRQELDEFNPEDLLTAEDFAVKEKHGLPTSHPFSPKVGGMQQVPKEFDNLPNFVEDLHNEEQFVTAESRSRIDENLQDLLSKENLAEERLHREIEDAKKKYSAVPDKPRDLLKSLLLKGELRKSFRLYGYSWTLRALDQGDLLLAVDDLNDNVATQAGKLFSITFSKVVYAIEEIEGIPIYQFFPDILPSDYNSRIEYIIAVKKALRAYLTGMSPKIIDALYDKYLEVETERDKALEQLKNS